MLRRELVSRLVSLVGGDVIKIVDRRDGWPGLARIRLYDKDLLAAVHIGPIGLSHRQRDAVERRFQNPGKDRPVLAVENALPLLIGIWEQGRRPVLVGMDAEARLGRVTRQSLFIPLEILQQGADSGWAEHHSTSGELIIAFHPALLPTYVDMRRSDLSIDAEQVTGILQASGLTSPVEEMAAERARRASSALVRNAQFAKTVVEAYGGFCAACGLDFGLVQGAHIYPVHAPGSVDEVWNGLALCSNHHAAFDRHLLWIEPYGHSLSLHPSVHSDAQCNDASRRFLDMSFPKLRPPSSARSAPRPEMFEKRYEFFGDKYSWAKG